MRVARHLAVLALGFAPVACGSGTPTGSGSVPPGADTTIVSASMTTSTEVATTPQPTNSGVPSTTEVTMTTEVDPGPWYVLNMPGATSEPSTLTTSDSTPEYSMAWLPDAGPSDSLLLLTVIPAHPFGSPEGDYATRLLEDFTQGRAWLLTPNGRDGTPSSYGFEVFWSRDNGDVWLFRSYGLTTEELVDLARTAQPGERQQVELADTSMHLVPTVEPGTIRQQPYHLDGSLVYVTVRNDGGVFDLIVSASEIRAVPVAGRQGYTATVGNGQVEVVWDAGDGWWAAVSVGPALAERADEIRDAVEPATA